MADALADPRRILRNLVRAHHGALQAQAACYAVAEGSDLYKRAMASLAVFETAFAELADGLDVVLAGDDQSN
jgi:hypothetical protein